MCFSRSGIAASGAATFAEPQSANPIFLGGGYIVLYYCHECDHGPFNTQLYASCTNCGHVFCESCNYTYAKESDKVSDSGNQNNDAESAPTPFPPVPHGAASTPQQILTSNEPAHGDGAEDTARELLPAEFFAAPPLYSTVDHSPEPVDGPFVWTCDACGSGPMLVDVAPACPECGHVRCAYCSLEAT